MNEADTDDAREGDGLDLAAAGAMPPLMLCSGTVSFSPPARCETSAPRGTPRAAGGARYRAHNSAGFDPPPPTPGLPASVRSAARSSGSKRVSRISPARLTSPGRMPTRAGTHRIRTAPLAPCPNLRPRPQMRITSPPSRRSRSTTPSVAFRNPGSRTRGTTAAGHPPSRGHDPQHALAGTARHRRILLRLRHQTRAETLDFHAGALEGVTILRPTTIGRIENTRPGPCRDRHGDELPVVAVEVA